MARKNTNLYQLEASKSLAASFTTAATVVTTMDNCAYQINITTSNSEGAFTVEASLDYEVNTYNPSQVINAGSWAPLALDGIPTVAAANDTIIINLNQLPFTAICLSYDSDTAGTGTADIYIATRQVGG